MSEKSIVEIQGLRAVAVIIVFIYHAWPEFLPGGFVGVDVFFVISGYLITGSLLKSALSNQGIGLFDFYRRRVKRLMPAAGVVALFCALSVPLLPLVQWPSVAKDILASTLYVQNWYLIEQSVDYLAQGRAPSLLQHYWSLSVEEQFYLVWPLLLVLTIRLDRLFNRKHRALKIVVTGVTLVSLSCGIWLTKSHPEYSYFSTFTRLWELSLGAMLAIWSLPNDSVSPSMRYYGSWLGIALIIFAAFFVSSTTPFPGWISLLPTLGAAFVLMGTENSDAAISVNSVLKAKPLVAIGDMSYSLYLWHWPLIIIVTAVTQQTLGFVSGGLTILLLIVLSHFSKVHIEDRFRRRTVKTGGMKFFFTAPGIASACVVSVVLASLAIQVVYSSYIKAALVEVLDLQVLSEYTRTPYNPDLPTIPDVAVARNDNPDLYDHECHLGQHDVEPRPCVFGQQNAEYTLLLVGDSHAAQWLPAFRALGYDKENWKIITHTKRECPFVTAPIIKGEPSEEYSSCTEWNARLQKMILTNKPTLLVTSMSRYTLARVSIDDTAKNMEMAIAQTWSPLISASIPIININDTPQLEIDVPECLSSPFGSIEHCTVDRQLAEENSPGSVVAQALPGVLSINVNDEICLNGQCQPNSGQVLIWRDSNHLTATYVRFLASFIGQQLSQQGIQTPLIIAAQIDVQPVE